MNTRHSYPRNGIVTITNILVRAENNDFPSFRLGRIAGKRRWFLKIDVNWPIIRPFITHYPASSNPNFWCYFNVVKADGSSFFAQESKVTGIGYGADMNIENLLNDGFLNDDGELSIEYGISVESYCLDDGIRNFNFYDKLMDSGQKWNMFTFIYEKNLITLTIFHCHKQLLSHHSMLFDYCHENPPFSFSIPEYFDLFEQCLQIAHGARIQMSKFDIPLVSVIAREYSLPNVVHYCEQRSIQMNVGIIEYAILFRMNRLLGHLMKKLKNSKELKKKLEQVDIETMSGEAMKKYAKFFFEN